MGGKIDFQLRCEKVEVRNAIGGVLLHLYGVDLLDLVEALLPPGSTRGEVIRVLTRALEQHKE